MHRLRYVVSGMVQGVGFRWFVLREAHRLELRGWVTNLEDGSVEVVAEGTETRLGELEAALKRGPRVAQVRDVAKSPVPPDVQLSNFFDIR
ncbi:MAG TPA: acylphosphatase [Gemmatimonadales bacterium]|nr:acylphosphatase [Gemmatimonadales bacterium]